MTPVFCITKHDPPNSHGDCLRACVASLLDCEPDAVPHFFHDGCSADVGHERLREYLATLGYAPFYVSFPGEYRLSEILDNAERHAHYLLFGATTNEAGHCVVCHGSEIVHNPSWIQSPIIGPIDDLWTIMIVARA